MVKVKDRLKTRIHTGTDADNRPHVNLVPNYLKKDPNDCPEVDKLKKQKNGKLTISNLTAQDIIKKYNLRKFIPGENLKQLSTSGIYIGYNPQQRSFYLKK
jgi:hypothetical protein